MSSAFTELWMLQSLVTRAPGRQFQRHCRAFVCQRHVLKHDSTCTSAEDLGICAEYVTTPLRRECTFTIGKEKIYTRTKTTIHTQEEIAPKQHPNAHARESNIPQKHPIPLPIYNTHTNLTNPLVPETPSFLETNETSPSNCASPDDSDPSAPH